jgi:hypothetical protein
MPYNLLYKNYMDTTKVEFVGKAIDRVIENTTNHTGLSTGEVALIAALIGAGTAIITQLLVFTMNRRKDKKDKKIELVADERRIARLLVSYYKELVMHKVHKFYWYRTSEIRTMDTTEEKKDSHERHFISNKESFNTLSKIAEATSEYFKIVTHYIILTNGNNLISTILLDIDSFVPRKASDFSTLKDYDELIQAESIEEKELNKVYCYYSECFDKIHNEMIKKL